MGKISFVALDPVSNAVFNAHREYSHGLGLAEVRLNSVPLAIVGGGQSAADNVEALRNFDGEVWAINEAFQWCRENDITATFYAIDPNPDLADACKGAEKAILADTVHPDVFKALEGADIELAPIRGPNGIQATISAAATAPFIAVKRSHTHVTYFGCDGSFTGENTHIYQNADNPRLWVDCGGREYKTTSQYIMSTEFIADVARLVPTWITAADDGFLSALIEHGDYDVTFVSREIQDALDAA
jgi:hypothetical protein